MRTLQLLSLSERAIGVQVIELKIEEGEIEVAVEASFEGLGLGLKPERIEQDLGVWRTKYSGKRVAMAAALSLQIDGSEIAPTTRSVHVVLALEDASGPDRVAGFAAVARGDAQDADPGRVAWEKSA